ncbi:hypothetical protein TWF569_001870 [Orbilia oligospora]|nr:hypothetical protein TWF569_001870 [Orbilia oligospora]
MASGRAIDPNQIPVGDLYEYNGPFPCFPNAPYSRRRNAGIPLDVPFHPEFLESPEASEDLYRMLSSTAAPSGAISSGSFIQPATPDQISDVEDWFLPINGQEDNLAGIGGNWDYVKWNAMVVACFMKQIQLGPNLRKLIRVHPPIQLYYEHDDITVTKAGIMGKKEFVKAYGRKDVNSARHRETKPGVHPNKITPTVPEGTTHPIDTVMRTDVEDSPEPDDKKGESKGEGKSEGKKGEGKSEGGVDSSEDGGGNEEYSSEDSSDEDTPDWLKLHPAPRGTRAVKHPLSGLYGDGPFLSLDSGGNWVAPGPAPTRDLMTLVDPDDPLSSILSKAAQELVNEAKDGKKGKKKKKPKEIKVKPSGDGGLRATRKRKPMSFLSKARHGARRKTLSDSAVLHRVGAKFGVTGLRMARSHDETDIINVVDTTVPTSPPNDTPKTPSDTLIPWEIYHSNIGGKGPDFRRRIWPSLKRDLGRKRWHLMPVACDVNGELRWWLMVIDMQVQRRWNTDGGKPKADGADTDTTKGATKFKDKTTDAAKDKTKDGTNSTAPERCIWVFNPCSTPSTPNGTVFERFLSEVPRYIYSLASNELSQLDHHVTPVVFPRSSDDAGMTNLQDGTLSAHEYDHPGRFKRFGFKVTINGNRFNWMNRNPQTGIEVIHAMGRVLRMMELEDARLVAMWRLMGENTDNLWCSVPTATVPTTALSLRDLDFLQESNEQISVQNRVRNETMVEIQRFMDWTQLRGYPFHEDTPDTIPEEGYRILNILHKNHADVWRQLSQWFDQGSHAVVVGIKLNEYSSKPNIVSFPLALGTMAVLHGKRGRHPADDPQTDWWVPDGTAPDGDTTGVDILATMPDDDPGKANPGYKYHRFAYLKEDYINGTGSIPVGGGPRKPTDIIENQYPQSMISIIIDTIGRGVIHVGNRPNDTWKVNGVELQQSEVITRFSHVTHLYGGSMHWLFLRRFATSKSENIKIQTTVKHDISNRTRTQKRSAGEILDEYSTDDPIWLYPRHTFPDEQYKKFKFNLGRDTPHLHHHHRPKAIGGQEEYLLWESYNNSSNTILCQNPACLQHSHHAGDKAIAVPNDTGRPCFNNTCVADKYETYYYGSTTCNNIHGNRCLPNIDGEFGPHIPGIPGHMFIDNGVLLFQPEMLLSSAEQNVNTQGVMPRATKPSEEEDGEEEKDLNDLPLPPLCWNRIVFTPVARFPSTTAVREFLSKSYNYEPMMLAEGEHGGVAYDMTMYERLNYYRILMWNQIQPSFQKGWWREQDLMKREHGSFTRYDVNGWAETIFRIGYQPDVQSALASGTAGAEEGNIVMDGNTIVGTGDPFAWDLAHGRLPDHTLPWDIDAKEGEGEEQRAGYASAAHMLGAYVVPEPTGEDKGTRSTRRQQVDGEGHANIVQFLKSISRRKPFDTLEDFPEVFSEEEDGDDGDSVEKRSTNTEESSARGKRGLNRTSDSRPKAREEELPSRGREPGSFRTDTALRCIPTGKDKFTFSKPNRALPPQSRKPKMNGPKVVYDMDGNMVMIEQTDTLLPKIRYYQHGRSTIEERYIEIKRKGIERPIILPVKRVRVEQDDGQEQDSVDEQVEKKREVAYEDIVDNHYVSAYETEERLEQKVLEAESSSYPSEKAPSRISPATESDGDAHNIPSKKSVRSMTTTSGEYQSISKRKRNDGEEATSELAPTQKRKKGHMFGDVEQNLDQSEILNEGRDAEHRAAKKSEEGHEINHDDNDDDEKEIKRNLEKRKEKLPRMLWEMQ